MTLTFTHLRGNGLLHNGSRTSLSLLIRIDLWTRGYFGRLRSALASLSDMKRMKASIVNSPHALIDAIELKRRKKCEGIRVGGEYSMELAFVVVGQVIVVRFL